MSYQLAKTNVKLGGQLKWNIVLDNGAVSNLYFSPISNGITYNNYNNTTVTNFNHTQNISSHYNLIKSHFFEDTVQHKFNTLYPIQNKGFIEDAADHTYTSGTKRLTYSLYNKQFECFCPVWLDDLEDAKNIQFRIVVASTEKSTQQIGSDGFPFKVGYNILSEQPINLTQKINGKQTFYDYLIGYASDIQLDNKLLYINFKTSDSFITGVHTETGSLQTKKLPYLAYYLLQRERPIMDTDSMIIDTFSQNSMICKQLFNFNFIFNLDDILPQTLYKQLLGQAVNIYVDVYTKKDGTFTQLKTKDFYSNYEYIPRYNSYKMSYDFETADGTQTTENVLDYLNDAKCLTNIYRNKITQQIIHWSIQNNNEYIFNLYEGFSPRYIDSDKDIYLTHNFHDSPILTDTQFIKYHNPFSWCKYNNLGTIAENNQNEVKLMTPEYRFQTRLDNLSDDDYTQIEINSQKEYVWIKSLMIDTNKSTNLLYKDSEVSGKLYISNIIYSQASDLDIQNLYYSDPKYTVAKIIYSKDQHFYILFKIVQRDTDYKLYINFIHNDKTNSSFPIDLFPEVVSFYSMTHEELFVKDVANNRDYEISNSDDDDGSKTKFFKDTVSYIQSILKSTSIPNYIYINKSVNSQLVDQVSSTVYSDSLVSEIEYYNTTKDIFLYRYDGNIIPTFIDLDNKNFYNYIYYFKQYTPNSLNYQQYDEQTSDFDFLKFNALLNSTKDTPRYPSINYYSLNSAKMVSDDENLYDSFYHPKYEGERYWYKHNYLINLPTEFKITGTNTEITDELVQKEIVEKLLAYRQFKDIYEYVKGDDGDYEKDPITNKYTHRQILTTTKQTQEDAYRLFIKNFIINLYDYKYTTDYISNTDITNYTYKITCCLK